MPALHRLRIGGGPQEIRAAELASYDVVELDQIVGRYVAANPNFVEHGGHSVRDSRAGSARSRVG